MNTAVFKLVAFASSVWVFHPLSSPWCPIVEELTNHMIELDENPDLQSELIDYKKLLLTELGKRKAKNPLYSLRSFARFLGISAGHLSHLLSGHRALTKRQALKISEKLNFSPDQSRTLLESVGFTLPHLLIHYERHRRQLAEEEFKIISDWQHYAILSLGELKSNQADPKWIAKRLGISLMVAKETFLRLKTLGYITIKNGSFRQNGDRLNFSSNIPSAAIRKFHQQNLQLAQQKIESVPLEEREFSSITMSGNPHQLNKIKDMIRKFKDKVSEQLEIGTQTEVYTMAVQLFPLTQKET